MIFILTWGIIANWDFDHQVAIVEDQVKQFKITGIWREIERSYIAIHCQTIDGNSGFTWAGTGKIPLLFNESMNFPWLVTQFHDLKKLLQTLLILNTQSLTQDSKWQAHGASIIHNCRGVCSFHGSCNATIDGRRFYRKSWMKSGILMTFSLEWAWQICKYLCWFLTLKSFTKIAYEIFIDILEKRAYLMVKRKTFRELTFWTTETRYGMF